MGRAVKRRNEFAEWQERLKRFEASGLSMDAFCRQEDVGRSTFVDWLQMLKKEPIRQAAVEESVRSDPSRSARQVGPLTPVLGQ